LNYPLDPKRKYIFISELKSYVYLLSDIKCLMSCIVTSKISFALKFNLFIYTSIMQLRSSSYMRLTVLPEWLRGINLRTGEQKQRQRLPEVNHWRAGNKRPPCITISWLIGASKSGSVPLQSTWSQSKTRIDSALSVCSLRLEVINIYGAHNAARWARPIISPLTALRYLVYLGCWDAGSPG